MTGNKDSKVTQIFNGDPSVVVGIVEGNQNNLLSQEKQKSLASTAKEIQDLLDKISKSYSPIDVPAQANSQINKQPILRQKIIGAIKSGGKAAIEELVDHPAVAILLAAAEGWTVE